ncbi:MAG: Gfo/Idh/MocA family protein, partial [Planctomycetota bacterium]
MKTIGVIGLGGIGVDRLKLLAGMDSVRVTALSTRNETVLAECAETYGVEAIFTDWRDMLADESLDAVCICTPNNMHAPMAEAAMEAGKDVLLEYPLAVTLEELDALIAVAERTGRILHLGATTRHEPQHVAVRERLAELGEP